MTAYHPSPNYTPSRAAAVTCVVLHTMAGNFEGARSWFANPASQVSSNYGVALDGRIDQYVALGDTSWANGILQTGQRYPGDTLHPNASSVSIETEDHGSAYQDVTDAQWGSVLYCVQVAKLRYPNIKWLCTHTSISPIDRTGCPGPRWTNGGDLSPFHRLATAAGLTPVL